MSDQQDIVFVDLAGTLLEHEDMGRPVPLMPQLLRALAKEGWQLVLLTRYSESYTSERLSDAGVELDMETIQSESKEAAVREVLDARDAGQVLFLDDNPRSVQTIVRLDDERVRAFGLVGSGKYCPQISLDCAQVGAEVILSAPDLAETLGVDFAHRAADVDFNPDEWASLLPSLADPLSDRPLERSGFDQGWPLQRLREQSEIWWRYAWPQAGWLATGGGLWHLLVEATLAAAQVDSSEVLSDAADAEEIEHQLKASPESVRTRLEARFAEALEALVRGLAAIGAEAEVCRPEGRSLERDRIEAAFDRLEGLYGSKAWLETARRQLEETRSRTLAG